jgi:CheY-specific phosphatase CheX
MKNNHKELVLKISDAVISATTAHFVDSLKIPSLSTQLFWGTASGHIKLRDMTAIIGLSGPFNALVAFSFDMALINTLLEIETAGLDIPEDELAFYRQDVIAETINIVLGHSTKALATASEAICLSPPMVLEAGGVLRQRKDAVFVRVCITTPPGLIDVFFISPAYLEG